MHSADSLRSSVSKNAILCLQDLLNFMPKQLETERRLRGRPFRWFSRFGGLRADWFNGKLT
jgi:hypothetical protein